MASKAPKHSDDIYVHRENWNGRYVVTARQNGKFVSTAKWTGKQSTEKVLERAWKGNITEERSIYTYRYQAKNVYDEPRNIVGFTRHRVFIGKKKKAKLHTKPIEKHIEDYYSSSKWREENPTPELTFVGMKLKAVYYKKVRL